MDGSLNNDSLDTNGSFLTRLKDSVHDYSRQNPVFFLFLLLMLPITVFAVQATVNYLGKAQTTNSVSVSFAPSALNLPPAGNAKIMLDSGTNKVAFARVVFNFDKNKIKLTGEISTNPGLSTVVQKSTLADANSTGKAVIVIAASPTDIAPSGNFELASFSVDAVSADIGASQLDFILQDMQIIESTGTLLNPDVTGLGINQPAGTVSPSPTDVPPATAVSPSATPLPYPTHTPQSQNSVSVSFSPPVINIPPAGPVKIMFDSGSNKVAFARVVFNYDKSKVKLTSQISTNSNFSTIVEKTSFPQANSQGKAIIVIAASPTDIQPSGLFEFASFTIDIVSGASDVSGIYLSANDIQIVNSSASELIPEIAHLGINGPAATPTPLPTVPNTPAPQPQPTSVSGEPALKFSPAFTNLPPDQKVKILIDSLNKKVVFARIVFSFDKTKVKLTSEITTNLRLSTVVQKSTLAQANTQGKAVIVIAASPTDILQSGIIELASFGIGAVTSNIGKTSLDFILSDVQIVDDNANIITSFATNLAINSDISIKNPIPSPNPNPSAACQTVGSQTCFNQWFREYVGVETTKYADLDINGKVTLVDFEIIRRALFP